jgi:CPA2 family monovalent cation:H+ antiporter-2
MDHGVSLITTVAAAFGVALILGFIAERIKVPALVGYLDRGHHYRPGVARLCGRRQYRLAAF